MNSYEILNVTSDSSDKEIEISYEDLKRKYDPSFNTSIRAYKKYREVLKAYENIKNEKRRQMYNLKDSNQVLNENKKEYKLFDFHSESFEKKEEKIDYSNLEEIDEVFKEDLIVNKRISYLYYVLNLKVDIDYTRKLKCDECSSFSSCPLCDGLGVVYYKEKQVYCPECHGKGEVSENCLKCDDEGFYNKKEKVSLFVDSEQMIMNDLGDEYYDESKSNLIVNFDFYDKENVEILDNDIYVNYYLSREETFYGVNKEYYSENGAFKLEVESFVDNEFKKEIIFNNRKIIFTFYNEKIDGENSEYYLFINKKYNNNFVYFNSDYSKCSINENKEFFNKLQLKEVSVIEGLGQKGRYGGNDGSLVIKCIFDNRKDIKYVNGVSEISTSKIFNILGGKIDGVKHYGFRGNNCLIESNNRYYLLSGNDKKKLKLKDYFLFKVSSLILWFVIPCIALFIPYGESMFITLAIVLFVYLIVVNALMEVKV